MRLNAFVAALTILLFSPAVLALSLGNATPQSHLNQPLRATIVVRAVKYDERDTIRAIIPDAAKFKRAGVRRDAIVENMSVEVIDGTAEDELLITISTEKRIKEPFVNFLVEVRWLGGSVMREYTLLLDPSPVAAARSGQAEEGSADVATQPLGENNVNKVGDQPAFDPAPVKKSDSRTYGPVKRQETLWSVAFSQRTDRSITMDQMQLAIYQANPQAFDGNINQLKSGSILTIPSNDVIRAIDPSQAKSEVTQQKRRYNPPAPAPAPVVAPAPAKPVPVISEATEEVEAEAIEIAPAPEIEEPELSAGGSSSDDTAKSSTPESVPGMAAASATAEGDALTEDEIVAEADQALESGEDLEMPSVWEEGESAEEVAVDSSVSAEPTIDPAEQETVVDEAPPESGDFLSQITEVVSPVTLLLGILLIVVIPLTYWWYRKRSVKNVGSQFAYVSAEDVEGESEGNSEEKKSEPLTDSNSPDSVWSDEGGVPDSIDEYTASTAGADELDLGEVNPQVDEPIESSGSERQDEFSEFDDATTVELEAGDESPIREMSSEEIDYLGEADVHLAYGLYDEAASVLQRGIDDNPSRVDLRLKLLEVFHSGSMADEFVNAAQDWKSAGVEDDDWKQVVAMGQEIAPRSELFGTGKSSSAVTVAKASVSDDLSDSESPIEVAEADVEIDVQPEAEEESSSDSNDDALDFDLSGFDLGDQSQSEKKADTATEEELSNLDEGLTLSDTGETESDSDTDDLDFSTMDLTEPSDASSEESTTESLEESLDDDTGESDSDFPLELDIDTLSVTDSEEDVEENAEGAFESITPTDSLEDSSSDAYSGRVDPVDDGDAGELSLDSNEPELDDLEDTPIADDPALDGPSGNTGDEEEVSVKLDLARAYMDMGEPEMARALLDEVTEMGNEQQRQEAQDLLSRA